MECFYSKLVFPDRDLTVYKNNRTIWKYFQFATKLHKANIEMTKQLYYHGHINNNKTYCSDIAESTLSYISNKYEGYPFKIIFSEALLRANVYLNASNGCLSSNKSELLHSFRFDSIDYETFNFDYVDNIIQTKITNMTKDFINDYNKFDDEYLNKKLLEYNIPRVNEKYAE